MNETSPHAFAALREYSIQMEDYQRAREDLVGKLFRLTEEVELVTVIFKFQKGPSVAIRLPAQYTKRVMATIPTPNDATTRYDVMRWMDWIMP